jgi:hypothetical protein
MNNTGNFSMVSGSQIQMNAGLEIVHPNHLSDLHVTRDGRYCSMTRVPYDFLDFASERWPPKSTRDHEGKSG